MLDDLKYINDRDREDALGIVSKQWQQYGHDFGFSWSDHPEIKSVVVAGMGGSGLAGKSIGVFNPKVSVEVVQGYELPAYVSSSTLLIASSYSGNTEETLSVLNQALERGDHDRPSIVVVSSGGKLHEAAEQRSLPSITLPSGFQPRMTYGYQLRALAEIFEALGLIDPVKDQLNHVSEWLKDQVKIWEPTEPVSRNFAKSLALDIVGKSIAVYASYRFAAAAYKWKISFNENSKTVAWYNIYSEFNHNEFIGWTSHPVEKPYAVIELRSPLDHPQIQKRFEVSERLLSGLRPSPEVVKAEGESVLEQLVWLVALGDFVSLYLAFLNGIDPTPVALIEEFKKQIE